VRLVLRDDPDVKWILLRLIKGSFDCGWLRTDKESNDQTATVAEDYPVGKLRRQPMAVVSDLSRLIRAESVRLRTT
jgi:hypothetical protein